VNPASSRSPTSRHPIPFRVRQGRLFGATFISVPARTLPRVEGVLPAVAAENGPAAGRGGFPRTATAGWAPNVLVRPLRQARVRRDRPLNPGPPNRRDQCRQPEQQLRKDRPPHQGIVFGPSPLKL